MRKLRTIEMNRLTLEEFKEAEKLDVYKRQLSVNGTSITVP